jgi:hypothetical protein
LYQYEPASGAPLTTYGQSLIGGKPFPIGPAVEDELPRLSPDGKWVELPSDESGSVEIVVRPFSPVASGGGTQVSFGGGHDPRWSRDGRELFYRTNDWYIVSVPVLDLSRHRFGKPATLFRLLEGAEYDVVDAKRVGRTVIGTSICDCKFEACTFDITLETGSIFCNIAEVEIQLPTDRLNFGNFKTWLPTSWPM